MSVTKKLVLNSIYEEKGANILLLQHPAEIEIWLCLLRREI